VALAAPEESLYLSAVTVGEIQAGIEITRKQDAVKAKEIELWLDGVEQSHGVLPADAAMGPTHEPTPGPPC
jgi:toxin FitB